MLIVLNDNKTEQRQSFLSTLRIEEISPDNKAIQKIAISLFDEYSQKYGDYFKNAYEYEDINQFKAPTGAYLTITQNNQYLAMGALRFYETKTAEFKRIWTHPHYRQLGLATTLVNALENKALAIGYTKIFLSTGFRQPQAVKLYCKLGYTPLFDINQPMENYALAPFDGKLRFFKQLT